MGWERTWSVLFSGIFFAATALAAADAPQIVDVSLGRSFVPIGFDNNDKVQVTVAGIFPDSCYKVGEYRTQVDDATQTIFIQQSAYRYGGECLPVTVPFTQVVDLGILREGNY